MSKMRQAELFSIDERAVTRVAAVLRRRCGKSAAVSRPELRRQTGLADRTIRRAIALLVERGMPIVDSDDGGYYVAVTKRELSAGAKHLTDKIEALAARLRKLVGSEDASEMLGQLNLFAHPKEGGL